MRAESARTGKAIYRPPQREKVGCANIRPSGAVTRSASNKRIKLPKRAQTELRALKRRLLAGYGARQFRPEFVKLCFMEFPALVSA